MYDLEFEASIASILCTNYVQLFMSFKMLSTVCSVSPSVSRYLENEGQKTPFSRFNEFEDS